MRKILMATLLASALSGCGAHAALPGAAPAAAKLAAKANTGFLAVLPVEHALEAALNDATEAWVAKGAQIASGPDGSLEAATDVQIKDIAARTSPTGAKDLVGHAIFYGTRPANMFVGHHLFAAFKARFANGKVSGFELVPTVDVPVTAPSFAKLGDADVKAFGTRLRAFLLEPAQQPLLRSRLWEALAGTDPSLSFTFDTVEATPGAFGEFGRVIRFRGTLKFQGGVVIAPRDMQLWVVQDPAGAITDVN
jgi:hypothetical protein